MFMRLWFLVLLLPFSGFAQEAEDAAESKEGENSNVPEVSEVISVQVAKLPAPSEPKVSGSIKMAISAANDEAQKSVRSGMLCLHAGWDFEAYRHFCAALKSDPQCLMAHWGVGMSLLHGNHQLREQQDAALTRMLALVDAGVGTELEKRYVFALIKLMRDGAQEAGNALAAASKEFPDDPQVAMLHALFSRGGFDEFGEATPDQERAESILRELIKKNPEEDYLKYALLGIRAEAEELKDDLPMARQICGNHSQFAPYFHLLGHYEWRCGNHTQAAQAFGRAADLYVEWMKSTGLDAMHCPGWTKAECYRAVALTSKGSYDTALAVADGVAAIKVPDDQASLNGARMLLWEGRTLPARILLKRGQPGDMKRASFSLPSLEKVKGLGKKTLALWGYQIHSSIVAGRIALEKGELDAARVISDDITRLGMNFVQTRETAVAQGERSYWLRAFKSFEVMAAEYRGLVTMAGPKESRGTAYNWYRGAADRQQRSSLMMPPAVLLPMEYRLAEYYLDREEPQKSIESLLSGLDEFPNDFELLMLLKSTFEKQGMEADVADVEKRLKAIQVE